MCETFLNRCRACTGLQECSEKMISLFEKNVFQMFTHCTSLEIDSNDSLPSHICFECFGHLSNFNKFRQNCADSEKYFRKQISTELIKVEPLHEIGIIKCEGNVNQEIKPEFYETEYIDENLEEQSESNVQRLVAPTDLTDPIPNSIPSSSTFDDKKYICDYCNQEFDQKSHIGSHMTKHKNEMVDILRPEQIVCNVQGCGRGFETRKLFNMHTSKVHKMKSKVRVEEERKPKIRCPKCPRMFLIQLRLDAHVRDKHEGLKPYKCSQCEKEFCTHRSYNYHLRAKHDTGDKKEYRCYYEGCDREYGLMDSLKSHIKRMHLSIKPVKRNQNLICDQCGRSFIDGHSLKKHIFTHSGNLPFACKICPKTFLTNYQLKNHTMRHLKIKPFECPICGARKTTNKELQYHLNFHSKEKTFPCKECPRVFTSYGAASRHVRIHHRNHKPYICPHCERSFAKAETMKNHVMTHTGEKPFACPVCDHRFIQAVAMRTHMKTHAKK